MNHPSTVARCKFDAQRDGNPCGRSLLGGVACPVHDHAKCSCGTRLMRGIETHCPKCGKDNRLRTVLKGNSG